MVMFVLQTQQPHLYQHITPPQTPAVTLAAPAQLEIIARPASRQTPQPAAVYANASYDLVSNGNNGAVVQARPVNVVRQAVEIKRLAAFCLSFIKNSQVKRSSPTH